MFNEAYEDAMFDILVNESFLSNALDILDRFEWMFRGGMRKVKDVLFPKEKISYDEAARRFLERMNSLSTEDTEATVIMRDTLKRSRMVEIVDGINRTMNLFRKHFELSDSTMIEHVDMNDERKKKIISTIMLSPKTTVADKIALLWILLSGKPLVFN